MPLNLCSPLWADFLNSGVSVVAAGRDEGHRPTLMRAVGMRFRPEQGEFTLFMCRAFGAELLQDIERNGVIAVVVSKPTTHQTIQLKSACARLEAFQPEDAEFVSRYVDSMVQELQALGFPETFTRALLEYEVEDLVAVSFVPNAAFDQTPGPAAGTRLDAVA